MLNKLQLQILPELQLQNLDQPLCSKSEQKFSLQAVANMILSINISNNNNSNKFWVDQPLCSKSEQKFSFVTKRQLPN